MASVILQISVTYIYLRVNDPSLALLICKLYVVRTEKGVGEWCMGRTVIDFSAQGTRKTHHCNQQICKNIRGLSIFEIEVYLLIVRSVTVILGRILYWTRLKEHMRNVNIWNRSLHGGPAISVNDIKPNLMLNEAVRTC